MYKLHFDNFLINEHDDDDLTWLSSTTTIAIYYYYSARKLIFIYRPTAGRRPSWPRHCRKGVHSPCPQDCKSQWFLW